MTDASDILNYLKANKNRLLHDYRLTQIGLFGSVARGEQTEDSDIDLVVEFEPDTADLHSLKARLKDEIQIRFDKPVDICRLKYIKPIFKKQILNDVRYV